MATIALAFVAALMLLFAVAFRGKLTGSAFRYALFGLVAGFLLGLIAGVGMGILYRFTPIQIPDPVFIFAGYATTLSSVLPFIFCAAGMIAGVIAALLRRET
jgi:hypothetical protein